MSILETGFVLTAAVTILVQVFLKTTVLVFLKTILLVFLEMTVLVFSRIDARVRDSRNESRADDDSRNDPLCVLILETVCVLKLIFNEMMKLFSMLIKMM